MKNDMKDHIEIIGPCSKQIQGRGWVTQIPVHLIENAGFVSTDKLMEILEKEEKKRKSEKEKAFWQGKAVGKKNKDVCIVLEKPSISCDGLTIRGSLK